MKKELEQLVKLAGTPAFKPALKKANEKYKDNPEAKKIIADLILREMQNTDRRLKVLETKIDEAIAVKSQMKRISEIISLSYVAKHYFSKSRHWLYHRINGSLINGKPATFKEDELKTLRFALKDISKQIGSLSV